MELCKKTAALIEIGTHRTVGSLMMQEIRYFKRLEVTRHDIPKKPCISNTGSSSNHPEPSVRLAMATKKRKKGISKGLLMSICTPVEVCDNKRMIRVSSGLGYRALKSDVPARLPA